MCVPCECVQAVYFALWHYVARSWSGREIGTLESMLKFMSQSYTAYSRQQAMPENGLQRTQRQRPSDYLSTTKQPSDGVPPQQQQQGSTFKHNQTARSTPSRSHLTVHSKGNHNAARIYPNDKGGHKRAAATRWRKEGGCSEWGGGRQREETEGDA